MRLELEMTATNRRCEIPTNEFEAIDFDDSQKLQQSLTLKRKLDATKVEDEVPLKIQKIHEYASNEDDEVDNTMVNEYLVYQYTLDEHMVSEYTVDENIYI